MTTYSEYFNSLRPSCECEKCGESFGENEMQFTTDIFERQYFVCRECFNIIEDEHGCSSVYKLSNGVIVQMVEKVISGMAGELITVVHFVDANDKHYNSIDVISMLGSEQAEEIRTYLRDISNDNLNAAIDYVI